MNTTQSMDTTGIPGDATRPTAWSTWWIMDGADDHGALSALDRAGSLDAQVQAIQNNYTFVAASTGIVYSFDVFLTADGKGMQNQRFFFQTASPN